MMIVSAVTQLLSPELANPIKKLLYTRVAAFAETQLHFKTLNYNKNIYQKNL